MGSIPYLVAAVVLCLPALCDCQTTCQTEKRLGMVVDAIRSSGLSVEELNVTPAPELRDDFMSLRQVPPDVPLLSDLCFYVVRRERYQFRGGEVSAVTVELDSDETGWYFGSSSRAVYSLKGFGSASLEFNRMMGDLHARIDGPETALMFFDLYLKVVYGQTLRARIVADPLKLIAVAADDFRLRYPAANREQEFKKWWASERLKAPTLSQPRAQRVADGYQVSCFVYKEGRVYAQTILIGSTGRVSGELDF
jgi:hypothetical protein